LVLAHNGVKRAGFSSAPRATVIAPNVDLVEMLTEDGGDFLERAEQGIVASGFTKDSLESVF
jgi:hypothetical protein